jgi:hypothetical protein
MAGSFGDWGQLTGSAGSAPSLLGGGSWLDIPRKVVKKIKDIGDAADMVLGGARPVTSMNLGEFQEHSKWIASLLTATGQTFKLPPLNSPSDFKDWAQQLGLLLPRLLRTLAGPQQAAHTVRAYSKLAGKSQTDSKSGTEGLDVSYLTGLAVEHPELEGALSELESFARRAGALVVDQEVDPEVAAQLTAPFYQTERDKLEIDAFAEAVIDASRLLAATSHVAKYRTDTASLPDEVRFAAADKGVLCYKGLNETVTESWVVKDQGLGKDGYGLAAGLTLPPTSDLSELEHPEAGYNWATGACLPRATTSMQQDTRFVHQGEFATDHTYEMTLSMDSLITAGHTAAGVQLGYYQVVPDPDLEGQVLYQFVAQEEKMVILGAMPAHAVDKLVTVKFRTRTRGAGPWRVHVRGIWEGALAEVTAADDIMLRLEDASAVLVTYPGKFFQDVEWATEDGVRHQATINTKWLDDIFGKAVANSPEVSKANNVMELWAMKTSGFSGDLNRIMVLYFNYAQSVLGVDVDNLYGSILGKENFDSQTLVPVQRWPSIEGPFYQANEAQVEDAIHTLLKNLKTFISDAAADHSVATYLNDHFRST